MKACTSLQPLLRQIAAAGYDFLVCLALLAATGFCAQLATGGQLFDHDGHLRHGWFRPLQVGVILAYLLLSWRCGGQTLGWRAWKLRLVAAHGGPPGTARLLRRLLAISLPWLALEAGRCASLNLTLTAVAALWTLAYAYGLIDPDRRTIQDCLAGTRLRAGE